MSESKKSNKQNKPSSSVDNLLDVLSIIVAGKKRVRSRASSISSATSVDSDMRRKKARQSVVTEFYCPLSGELLVDPVVADDDYLYERAEIERHIDANRADLKSPKNGKRMGTLLLPASQNVLNSIKNRFPGCMPKNFSEMAVKMNNPSMRVVIGQLEDGGQVREDALAIRSRTNDVAAVVMSIHQRSNTQRPIQEITTKKLSIGA